MNVLYVALMRFPNEKAHGKQVKEMCNALSTFTQVTLVVPTRKTEGDPRAFGLSEKVDIVRLPAPDLVRFGRIGFLITYAWFALISGWYVWRRRAGSYVITREYPCALLPVLSGVPTIWESHRGEWNWLVRLCVRAGAVCAVLTRGLERKYRDLGVRASSLMVAPDGADLSRYEHLPSRADARKKLGLPEDAKVVLYNGHLHTWKGAGTLAQAAAFLSRDTRVLFMGGAAADIESFRQEYGADPRITLLGRKDDGERPIYLRAADVLVLPNTGKDEISVSFTSPLKLFGYMAAQTPIVASDLPSIREIVSEREVFFAAADDSRSFADAIKKVFDAPEDAARHAQAARLAASRYDWKDRARAMLAHLAAGRDLAKAERAYSVIMPKYLLLRMLLALRDCLARIAAPSEISILCYHSISNAPFDTAVSPEAFEEHLDMLARCGARFVSLDDVIAWMDGSRHLPQRAIAITFDDGYRDFVDIALPILEARHISVALFALGESETSRPNLHNDIPLLSAGEIEALRLRAGVTIGYHGMTHALATRLAPESFAAEYGPRYGARYFAYPGGHFNEAAAAYLREAAYTAAFTVKRGLIDNRDDRFLLRRTVVLRGMPLWVVRAHTTRAIAWYRAVMRLAK